MTGLLLSDKMRQTKKEMYRNNITKEEINELEVYAFNGRITVVEDESDLGQCMQEIRRYKVIGFDTESKPSFRKNSNHKVSLIQIAVPGGVYLFRINKMGFKQGLIDLFEDPQVKKVGVSIHDDIQRLRALSDFNPENLIELQDMSNEFGIESNSLRKLAAIILGFRISKSQQLTNWEAQKLTEKQIVYAATDAWASLEIYRKLELLN